jgi:large exoprotein involved in heme utilization and adhesion
VLYPSLQYGPNINGQSFANMGTITISEGSVVDVSADAAGTIKIRGGQFVMADATLSADTANTNGSSTAIDINVTGDVSISDARGVSAITARTTGIGDAGEVRIESANLSATSSAASESPFALIDTHTSGSGRGGNISITTGNLTVTGAPNFFFIDSGTIGPDGGTGGNVTITAVNMQLQQAAINTGDFIAQQTDQEAAGSGGNLMINAETIQVANSAIATDSFSGRAGDIMISAHNLQISDFSLLEQIGLLGTGHLSINADRFTMDSSQINSETAIGSGGGVTITGMVIEFKNGSTVQSQTLGDGPAGDIRVTATDHLTLSDDPTTLGARTRPTGLFTNSLGDPDLGTHGNAGAVIINTPQLMMTGGARIDTTTQTNGHGGDITITAPNSISIAGGRPTPVLETELFGLGSSRPSGIFTRTVGSDLCTGACGNAGRISITTGSLSVIDGAQINSGTTTTGQGGNMTINATGPITISGVLSDNTPSGIFSQTVGTVPDAGEGGTISLTAGQSVSLSNGASIAASSSGPANAGNIFINAGNNFTSTNSSVTTQATQASGGNITVTASDMIRLTNSQINASVQGSQTTIGGNIVIDPNFVILQNSQILAQATQGQGGNISITTNSLLTDANSLISASSQSGVNGTVNVQSPISQAGGKIIPLSKTSLEMIPLLSQRCAALVSGQYSSFLVAGRETLPTEPGAWLATPLMAMSVEEDLPSLREGLVRLPVTYAEDGSLVSLRRLPTSGARATLFSSDWPEGCGS